MGTYIAAARSVKVAVGPSSGNRVVQIIDEGAVLPAGVEQDQIDRLVRRGLVKAVDTDPEIPDGEPSASWSIKQLKAFADREGIDLDGARSKQQLLAALAPNPDPDDDPGAGDPDAQNS